MCLDIGNSVNAMDVIHQQTKFISAQQKDDVPMQHVKIRCVCLKLVKWNYMHRCLYCSVFFCKTCAEEHFGKTVEQYKAENT